MSEQPIDVLFEFEKSRATVRAYITSYRGKRYCHVREFVEPRDRPGAELIATKAGICVEISDLDELEAAVRALRAAAA
jgi:Transcriptional Coactivator p15 (PC4)